MKLLLDENLSHRLVSALAEEYPGSQHIDSVGLHGQYGQPPKVVWLCVGNASTDQIAKLLKRYRPGILTFASAGEDALLELRLPSGLNEIE